MKQITFKDFLTKRNIVAVGVSLMLVFATLISCWPLAFICVGILIAV
jgi:hypothetical protein